MKKWGALVLALILAMCQLTSLAEETPDYDHLVVGSTTAFSGHFAAQLWGTNTADLDVSELLFGYNLVEWQNELGVFDVDPTVVTGVSVRDDEEGNRTYTLALSKKLYYSDGSPITAQDYAFTILLSAAPEVESLGCNTDFYSCIKGMDLYQGRKTDSISGVRVLNDHLLQITIDGKYRPFFYEMGLLRCAALPISVIAPGCSVEDDGNGVFIDKTAGTFTVDALTVSLLDPETGYVSHPSVTSGPYKLISYDGQVAEFEINEYYKGDVNGVVPTIPYLTFKTVSNDTMMEQLSSGELGLINKVVSSESIATGLELIGEGAAAMSSYARIGQSFVSFCCEKPAMADKAVRQAIALCMDKDTLVNDYVGSFGLRVDGYYGIGQWMYQMLSGVLEFPVEEPAENASAADKELYESTLEAWEALNMDEVTVYDLDLEAAADLLDKAGWNLNSAGEAYDPAAGGVRCGKVDGAIVPLELELIYPEGNTIAASLQKNFADNLAQVGISLSLKPVPMTELLEMYYRNVDRSCDMIYLASNFDVVFDPSNTYEVIDGQPGVANYSAIVDEKLFQSAKDMSMTESGDVLTYCQKWVAFQEVWAETLPAIPVYSNAYFDFYTTALQDYNISSEGTWAYSIVAAFLGDPAVEEEEMLEDGEIIFD